MPGIKNRNSVLCSHVKLANRLILGDMRRILTQGFPHGQKATQARGQMHGSSETLVEGNKSVGKEGALPYSLQTMPAKVCSC